MKEKDLLKKIGGRIKEVRIERGMSQQELAAKIDYEKSNMSRLEAGNTNPTILTLYLVANALDISLHDLVKINNNRK